MATRRLNCPFGPSSRWQLKKTSPFASLLMDIADSLTTEDVSHIKLALLVDKVIPRMALSILKHPADAIYHLYGSGIISETDTEFLEQLLLKIGRRDLEKKLTKYHDKRAEVRVTATDNTQPKLLSSTSRPTCFTNLKSIENLDTFDRLSLNTTVVKEVCPSEISMLPLDSRKRPEGISYTHLATETQEDECPGSQMSVDGSQKSSQMSISDDEKVSLNDKLSLCDDELMAVMEDV